MNLGDVTNAQVLDELFKHMRPEERAVLCSVAGDPSTVDGRAWGGIPWAKGCGCPLRDDRNNYVAISSFKANEQGGWRRRKDQFGAVHAIMIDDVGTKIDMDKIAELSDRVLPTMVVETSPKNYQMTYALDEPLLDQVEAEDAITQIIAKLTNGGADPGMAGITRVLRLPGGINGKPKYAKDDQPFKVRLTVWRPDTRIKWDDLCMALRIVKKYRTFSDEPTTAVTMERKRCFNLTLEGLGYLRLVKQRHRGWIDIRCPWLREHTDRADTGSAVAYPDAANGWYGGFKCHHGHCEQRNWADLETEVAERVIKRGEFSKAPYTGEKA